MQPNPLANVEATDAERAAVPRLSLTCAADVAPERVKWLWDGWLPYGKLVSLDGVAGVGKSTMVIDLISRATRGGPMPYSEARFDPATVMICGVEDGWADTIRPRLDAAAADLSRVHFVTTKTGTTVTIPRDVVELLERATDVGATWLHIDAIMGVLDEDVSANSDHEVRRALGSLKDAISAAGVLATFVRHPRKAGGSAVHAGGGSVAFTALSRVGLFVGLKPGADVEQNDQHRVLAVGKSNLMKHPKPLAFTVESSMNGVGHIAWHGPVNITADELASPLPPSPPRAEPRERADPYATEKTWLREHVPRGQRVKLDTLKAAAAAAGIPWHRVKRAGRDDGISHDREGFPSFSVWYFPEVQSEQLEQSEQQFAPVGNAVPTVPTVPTEPVLVTLHTGETFDTTANDPSITELRDLIARVEPITHHAA